MQFQIAKMPGRYPTPPKLRADGQMRIRKCSAATLKYRKPNENFHRGSGKTFADFIRNKEEQRRQDTIRRHKIHQDKVTIRKNGKHKRQKTFILDEAAHV